jgi:hypothetical protein
LRSPSVPDFLAPTNEILPVPSPNKVVGITHVPAVNSGRTLFRAAVSLHFGWFETWTTVPITDLGIGGGTLRYGSQV